MATHAIIAAPTPGGGWSGAVLDADGYPTAAAAALLSYIPRRFVTPADAARHFTVEHPHGYAALADGDPTKGFCYCHDGAEGDTQPYLYDQDSARGEADWAYVLADDGLRVIRVRAGWISDPETVPWGSSPEVLGALERRLNSWSPVR